MAIKINLPQFFEKEILSKNISLTENMFCVLTEQVNTFSNNITNRSAVYFLLCIDSK